MKKYHIFCLILAMFTMFSFVLICPPTSHATAETPTAQILTPKNIASLNNKIAVQDGNKIKIFASTPADPQTGATLLNEITMENLTLLKSDSTNLYCLTETDGIKSIVMIINADTPTTLEFPTAYPTEAIQDFFIDGDNIFILRNNNLSIDILKLSTTEPLTVETTIDHNYLEYYKEETRANHISFNNGYIFVASNTKVYKIDTQTKATTISHTSTDPITTLTKNYVATKTTATNLQTQNLINLNGETAGITEYNDSIFATYPNTHQINKIDTTTGTLTNLNINKQTVVNYYQTPNFKYLKTTGETNLLYEPYSPNPTQILPENNYLTAIGETETHYYCLIPSNNKNIFLYVHKSANLELLDIGEQNTIYTATREAIVFALPSTIIDNANRKQLTLPATTEVTVLNTTIIYNTAGESFYLIKTGETYGFVKAKLLQSNKLAVELTKETNAKTKRETTLYETENGETAIIKLSKKSRITLTEEYSSKKEYLSCEYQDEKGIVYTGFIASADVSPDGLSTLQILGLILVGTNILLLLLILIIKLNSKKWKV